MKVAAVLIAPYLNAFVMLWLDQTMPVDEICQWGFWGRSLPSGWVMLRPVLCLN